MRQGARVYMKNLEMFFNQFNQPKICQQINYVEKLGAILMILSLYYLGVFGYQLFSQETAQRQTLAVAEKRVELEKRPVPTEQIPKTVEFSAVYNEPLGTVEIPKLNRILPVIEGTDANVLKQGVGHISETAFPGQNEQIIISGHRDTVFRNFNKLEIGDDFIINMPYGTYTYEMRKTDIVSADDTTVIRKMGEEVLVITTCYPFNYIGDAPQRFIIYAYPVENQHE